MSSSPNIIRQDLYDAIAAQQESKVPPFTSVAATGLLRDKAFLHEILDENPKLLLTNYLIIENFLEYYEVPRVPAIAGVYVFARLLSVANPERPINFDEDSKLDAEFKSNNVRLNRGGNFHSTEAGWFRIVFGVSKDRLVEGLKELRWFWGLRGGSRRSEMVCMF